MENISNAYLHHLQQQQQQHCQNIPQQLLQQQEQLQQQHHPYYQYQQNTPSYSLPSLGAKSLYGPVQPLEHASVHYSSGLAHLPSPTTTPVSSASGLPFHQTVSAPLTSQISTQLGLRNLSTEFSRPKTPQQVYYQAPSQVLKKVETHFSGGGPSATDYTQHAASLHGLGGLDMQISRKFQQSWENCLPPSVEPPTTLTHSQTLHYPHVSSYQIYTTKPRTGVPAQAGSHPLLTTNPWTVMPTPVSSHQMLTVNPSTAMPAHMAWPRKKKTAAVEKKIPVVKTTTMKQVGAVQGGSSENGPGWCSVCQRNCITEAALKQHFDGKKHKKQVERQRAIAEEEAKKQVEQLRAIAKEEAKKRAVMDEGGGGEVATVIQQMWVQVSMMGKSPKPKKAKATKGPGNLAAPMPNPGAGAANTVLVDVNETPVNETPDDGNIILEEDGNAMDINATPGEGNDVCEGDGNATCLVSNAVAMDGHATGDENATHVVANDVPMDANVRPGDGDVISEGGGNLHPSPAADPSTLNLNCEPAIGTKKEEVWFRCELCNVACNRQGVLETHFRGKKHLNKLKKLQESPASEQMAQ